MIAWARAELTFKEAKVTALQNTICSVPRQLPRKLSTSLEQAKEAYGGRFGRTISLEDYRNAALTEDKFAFDVIIKKEAVKIAETELRQSQTVINSRMKSAGGVSGVIAAIRKHPGEAVRKLETVFEIEVTDKAE